ncbi:MAG: bifunctional hydroxymethylpyrimidine kinase/phosphomethylpyrimidine kinase [Minwuia sp.]|uniref:bifunctional hydroxymethylpyrimidine kinase/phosphomethylpyrimidine kinase n=1 Tax=Minwuia sp. TaxID=2493630 RepID=UPI003A89738F
MKGRVLIAAGSDSGGGAGIQADIKAVTALGGYAATAITALTAQDTHTVHGIHEVPLDFIRQQMQVVLADIGADAIKTGMLHRRGVIEVVAEAVAEHAPGVPLVADPVMVAKGGARLLDEDATEAAIALLLPLAYVVTPNIPEAEVLSGLEIADLDGMKRAAEKLKSLGPKAVLLKGGHMSGETLTDLLLTDDGFEAFAGPRIETAHTHGTGCTTASALACGLAQGLTLKDAFARARAYVQEAIRSAPGYGSGHGPLNHAHTVRPPSP